jgi:hypothetical protein
MKRTLVTAAATVLLLFGSAGIATAAPATPANAGVASPVSTQASSCPWLLRILGLC